MRRWILGGSSRISGMERLRIHLIMRGGKKGVLGYRKKLKRCVSNLEFGGVMPSVGIREGVVLGPYVDRKEWEEEEEGMDVDEYDDSDSEFRIGDDNFGGIGRLYRFFWVR